MGHAYRKEDGTVGWDTSPDQTGYELGQYSYRDIKHAKARNDVSARTEMIQQAMRNPERFETSVSFEKMRDLLALRGDNESRTLDQRIDWAVYQLEKENGWQIPTEDHYYEEDDAIYRVPTDWGMFSDDVAAALHDPEALQVGIDLHNAKVEAAAEADWRDGVLNEGNDEYDDEYEY